MVLRAITQIDKILPAYDTFGKKKGNNFVWLVRQSLFERLATPVASGVCV
jgi:hypothetical protein